MDENFEKTKIIHVDIFEAAALEAVTCFMVFYSGIFWILNEVLPLIKLRIFTDTCLCW